MSAGRLRLQNGSELSTDWRVGHAPTADTQATATQAAVAATVPASGLTRNVCTGITVAIAGGTSAPAAKQVTVAVIDGASGDAVYLWGPMPIAIPGLAGALNGFVCIPMFEIGTPYTAMTIEFSAAGGANTVEAVWMTGTTI